MSSDEESNVDVKLTGKKRRVYTAEEQRRRVQHRDDEKKRRDEENKLYDELDELLHSTCSRGSKRTVGKHTILTSAALYIVAMEMKNESRQKNMNTKKEESSELDEHVRELSKVIDERVMEEVHMRKLYELRMMSEDAIRKSDVANGYSAETDSISSGDLLEKRIRDRKADKAYLKQIKDMWIPDDEIPLERLQFDPETDPYNPKLFRTKGADTSLDNILDNSLDKTADSALDLSA